VFSIDALIGMPGPAGITPEIRAVRKT